MTISKSTICKKVHRRCSKCGKYHSCSKIFHNCNKSGHWRSCCPVPKGKGTVGLEPAKKKTDTDDQGKKKTDTDDQEKKKTSSNDPEEAVGFSMQVNAQSEGLTHQTSISKLSGIVDQAEVRGILPGQHQQQGRWDYKEVEEMNIPLQALIFMANQGEESQEETAPVC